MPRAPYYKRKRAIHARASWRKGLARLASTRRNFLHSLCRSALVLPLEKVLALALPLRRQQADSTNSLAAAAQTGGTITVETAKQKQDLGVTFLNVARDSGLNAKTT